MNNYAPILTAHLFPIIEGKLIELLRSLTPEEWDRETIVKGWKVRDVTAHLLDTQLRKLSIVRDGFIAEVPQIRSAADLVQFINRLNQEGVSMYRRLSGPMLIALMEVASHQSAQFHQSLDPHAPAAFAVSWAGESTSPNWFDTARELTERWHHQQQIRLAVNRPGIMTRELYHPVLDCFLRALPFTYRNADAPEGTVVDVEISGECGGTWSIRKEAETWKLFRNASSEAQTKVQIPQEIAWRVFTKGIDRTALEALVKVEGDPKLASPVLGMTAIVG